MGHRANFVIIENGAAKAYFDDWAALGCIHCVADGPRDAAAQAADFEPTDELLDWAFMEGGYLVDFDERTLIVFGMTEDEFGDEFSDLLDEDSESSDGSGASVAEDAAIDVDDEAEAQDEEWDTEAERASAMGFLQGIASNWPGWTLRWDQRGADAFAEHLQRRNLTGIRTQPPSCEGGITVELRA